MPCTFAGVHLLHPSERSFKWLWAHIRPEHILEADTLFWYEHYSFGHQTPRSYCPHTLNTLSWPNGAAHWGRYLSFAGKTEVDEILLTTNGASANSLVLDDGLVDEEGDTGTVTASMYMLPPIPLSKFAVDIPKPAYVEPLYLLCFVDKRFWWAGRKWDHLGYSNTEQDASTVLSSLGTALGESFSIGSYSSTKLVIPVGVASGLKSAPKLLDAVCQSLGLRVVLDLDGTVNLLAASSGESRANTNATLGTSTSPTTQLTGGVFQWGTDVDYHAEVENFLPTNVLVTYPRVEASVIRGEPVYSKQKTITDFITVIPPLSGNGKTYTLQTMEKATYTGPGGSPSNQATLDTYATTYAGAWYTWNSGTLDLQNSGITPYTPDGLHRIEWVYGPDYLTTRIVRQQYDESWFWTDKQNQWIENVYYETISQGTYNNYTVPGPEYGRWGILPGGPVAMTGLQGGLPGQRIEIQNRASQPNPGSAPSSITFPSNSTASTYPIQTPDGFPLTIQPGEIRTVKYDGTDQKWFPAEYPAGTSVPGPSGGSPYSGSGTAGTLPDPVTVPHGGTGLTTLTTGYLLAGNGTDTPTLISPGTSGQVLTSAGPGVPPSFSTATGGTSVNGSGTSTAGYVTVFDFDPGGPLISSFAIEETGGVNSVTHRVTAWSDMTTALGSPGTIVGGNTGNSTFYDDEIIETALTAANMPRPYNRIKLEVIDTVAGNHGTWRVRGLCVRG